MNIQGVYSALFGRSADALGLAFFNSATADGTDLSAIGDLDILRNIMRGSARWTVRYHKHFIPEPGPPKITTIGVSAADHF